jgi:hypothetical protein
MIGEAASNRLINVLRQAALRIAIVSSCPPYGRALVGIASCSEPLKEQVPKTVNNRSSTDSQAKKVAAFSAALLFSPNRKNNIANPNDNPAHINPNKKFTIRRRPLSLGQRLNHAAISVANGSQPRVVVPQLMPPKLSLLSISLRCRRAIGASSWFLRLRRFSLFSRERSVSRQFRHHKNRPSGPRPFPLASRYSISGLSCLHRLQVIMRCPRGKR